MNPRLIRANIALFQGKRSETRRLLEEYIAEQPDARRSPIVMWLDAHSQPRQAERMNGLNILVENAPADDNYHRMAKNYLAEEQRYAALLDDTGKGRALRPWQIVAGIVAIVAILGLFVLLGQASQPTPEVTEEPLFIITEEATEELPTPTPSPTPIVQNEVQVIRLPDGSLPFAEYIRSGGQITVRGVDPALRAVVDARGVPQEPLTGATFYGVLLEFQCLMPICNNVPEAEIYVRLSLDGSGVKATEGLLVAGEPQLAGRAAQGQTVQGWVVFELPRNNPPSDLVVWPFAPTGSDERPQEIAVPLS